MWLQNRKALQAFHSDSYHVLEPLLDSPFEAQAQGLSFLGKEWPFVPLPPLPVGCKAVLFGLPTATELAALLANQPQRLLVVDSQPERVWAQMMAFDYSPSLADPVLELLIQPPDKLLLAFPKRLSAFRDLFGLAWRESQPATELAERMNDLFLLQGFRLWQEELSKSPTPRRLAEQVQELYRELLPASERAYAQYPLSCGSGCAGCCHKGVGTLLTLTPGEWLLFWQALKAWPEQDLQNFAQRFGRWAAQEIPLIHSLWAFFEREMKQVHTPEFSIQHLALIESQQEQPCFFLNPQTQTCRVYDGRPLTCRLFGVSQFYGNTPYTCELDWEKQEQILLREGPSNQLVQAEVWRQGLGQIHRQYPYKMPLVLWLVCHLDVENAHWISEPRLDYAQFEVLSNPARLSARLPRFKNADRHR